MLGIMVGLDQKDSYALFPGCGMYKAGIAAILGAFRFQRNPLAGGESFSPDNAYDSAWNSFKPMKGKYIINYFQYQDDVGCVCMHNDASAASTVFAQTTTTIPGSS